MTQDKGASDKSDRATAVEPVPVSPLRDGIPSADGRHPYYGPCDGFGPLGMCSECTGIIHCNDGSFVRGNAPVSKDEAADIVGRFLLREAGCAALAAAMHTSEPKAVSRFVEDVMGEVLPRSFAQFPEQSA